MPRSLIVRIIVPTAAVLSLVGQPASARGPACWNSDELPAAELHAFHTTLMVGALKCRSERPEVLGSYNAFVQARKSSIDAARAVLQARFIREVGLETGLAEFKNFDTEIANRASLGGPDALPCDGVDIYSRLAASASHVDLHTLARLNNSGVEIRSCGLEPTLAVAAPGLKATRREVPEQAEPMLVAAKTDASPEVPPAVAGPISPVVPEQQGNVMRPETLPAGSKTQEIGSETLSQESVPAETAAQGGNANVDPVKALEDAARALAVAATSLRAGSSANQ